MQLRRLGGVRKSLSDMVGWIWAGLARSKRRSIIIEAPNDPTGYTYGLTYYGLGEALHLDSLGGLEWVGT